MQIRRFIAAPILAILLAVVSFTVRLSTPASLSVLTAEVSIPPATAAPLSTSAPSSTPLPTDTATPQNTPTAIPTPTDQPTVAPTHDPNQRAVDVPILMYHYLSVPPPDADKYRLDLSVTPINFKAQLDHLSSAGYTPIRVDDLSSYLLTGTPLPPKPILLTFDDGYLDNYTYAFPILQQYGYPATFFVVGDFIDKGLPGYLTWNQVEEMAEAGMEIGSHSLDHISLRGKPSAFQLNQITGSKTMIESHIGTVVQSFSYPSGDHDGTTVGLLRSTGYLSAVTEAGGVRQSTAQIFDLSRVRVRGSYSVTDLVNAIAYFTPKGN